MAEADAEAFAALEVLEAAALPVMEALAAAAAALEAAEAIGAAVVEALGAAPEVTLVDWVQAAEAVDNMAHNPNSLYLVYSMAIKNIPMSYSH